MHQVALQISEKATINDQLVSFRKDEKEYPFLSTMFFRNKRKKGTYLIKTVATYADEASI